MSGMKEAIEMRWNDHARALLCCALAAVSIVGTISWMEKHAPNLNADVALERAEQSIQGYCTKHRMAQCDLHLISATAPEAATGSRIGKWRFAFYSAHAGQFLVNVPVDGRAAQVSR